MIGDMIHFAAIEVFLSKKINDYPCFRVTKYIFIESEKQKNVFEPQRQGSTEGHNFFVETICYYELF